MAIAILQGRYVPGDLLPSELELTTQFKVSRSVIREALKTVAAKGLIAPRKKAGTKVQDRRHWQALDPQMLIWRTVTDNKTKLVRDLVQIRNVIEPAAAAAAANVRTDAAIREIDLAFREMVAQQDDPEMFIEPDLRFHKAILAATGNDFFVAFGALIETALRVFLRVSMLHEGAPGPSIPMHGAVLEAIRSREPEIARRAMAELMDRTRSNVERNLRALLDKPKI
jgi:DNA-binding FadR family transcriptional regulator